MTDAKDALAPPGNGKRISGRIKTPEWIVSDTHFGHAKMLGFEGTDGGPLRPFASVDEMDETLIQKWNERVRPHDRILHLGDVSMNYDRLEAVMRRLNGRKSLIPGNHDRILDARLMDHFEAAAIWATFMNLGITCSHIPLMPSCFLGKAELNVHGHTHSQPNETSQHDGRPHLREPVSM